MAQGAEQSGWAYRRARLRWRTALGELDQGRPAVIELVGEPGIGKTRLLAELARHADARGQIVLSGSASELERDLPFWVFVDALDDYVRGLEPRRLDVLADDVRSELAPSCPACRRRRTARDAVLHERYRSYRAVRELLELLARRSRSCSSSTTCTGATRPRSSCSGHCSTARRRLPCCWRSRCARARCRSGSRRRSSERTVRAG